jgi:hypothetical protein
MSTGHFRFSLRRLFGAVACFAVSALMAVRLLEPFVSADFHTRPKVNAIMIMAFTGGIGTLLGSFWKGVAVGCVIQFLLWSTGVRTLVHP